MPAVPSQLRDSPFRSADALAAGLTRRQLQGRSWRRVCRDVYVHADVPDTTATRAAGMRLVLPAGAAVSGESAAWLYGIDIRTRPDLLHVTVPRERDAADRPGLCVRQAVLPAGDVIEVHGLAATTPTRTAFDLARLSGPVESVVALDAMAHAGIVDLAEVRALAGERHGWRGVRAAVRAVDRADPRAESPQETRTRLVLVDGGLPRPEVQYVVADQLGWFVARLDLAYPEVRLGIEYDGNTHRETWQQDIRRQTNLAALGWVVLRYTASDIYRRPGFVVAQVRQELVRHGVAC